MTAMLGTDQSPERTPHGPQGASEEVFRRPPDPGVCSNDGPVVVVVPVGSVTIVESASKPGSEGPNPAKPVGPDIPRQSPSPNPQTSTAPNAPSALVVSLLNAIGEGVGLATRSGQVLWANDQITRLSGAMLERIGGLCRQFDREHPALPRGITPPPDYVPPRSDSMLADSDRFFELTLTPAQPGMVEVQEGHRKDGRELVIVTIRDVTSSKKLQQKIAAIDLAGSELVRVDAEVVRKLNAHERLKLLESKIIRIARELLHFDHFAIRLLDERSGKLELVIWYNLPPEFDSFTIKPGLQGYGISGHVAASGRSYVCPDTAQDSLYLPGVSGAKSSLTVPLKLHEKVIGIMNVESLKEDGFTEDDRRMGEIFARYIAIAIHTLDLLVIESCAVNQKMAGRVAFELQEPLQDIAHEIESLGQRVGSDPFVVSHLDKIRTDLHDIRERLKEVAAGPQTLLGVEQAMAASTADPLFAGKRIMIADDSPQIRKIIAEVLTKRGCDVVVCENGSEAMDALKNAEPAGFHLVISDIRMPDHNGYEIYSASRATNRKPPVILMTGFGYDPHHSIVRASQEGLSSVLFKPFQVERLIDEVKKALTAT